MKFLEKSRALPFPVDNICYDLEDSVTTGDKDSARENAKKILSLEKAAGIREQGVRINSLDSGLAERDLKVVLQAPHIDTIIVPKVHSKASLSAISDMVMHLRPPPVHKTPTELDPPTTTNSKTPTELDPPTLKLPKILALIESARGITDLPEISTATSLLDGFIFAAEDFALDLSLTRTPSLTEFLYARSAMVTAARAADLGSTIDLVCTAFRDDEGRRRLEEECRNGRGLGFNGKQCIHPTQVPVVQEEFSPGMGEVEWAVKVMVGDEKAEDRGRGAWTLNGMMIDRPVAERAKAVVRRAEGCGLNVEKVRRRWEGLEPE
ncbi:MAG: hypothetical protein M1834_002826 [Cirrosporium novae-zelandiae]|nr:MAG: hypothetical protein M1834_002826 [Cirrosporium novae-zelandiae]